MNGEGVPRIAPAPLDQSVHIGIERMKRALAGPRYRLPQGMSVDQIIAFMDEVSKAYADALEEAAQTAESDEFYGSPNQHSIAAAIRALKKPRASTAT